MTEEELKQKAKLFIISHKQNKFMFDISLVDLLTLFATKITKELEQELERKRIAIKTRKARIKDLEKENIKLRKLLEEADNATDCFNKQEEIIEKAKEIIRGLLFHLTKDAFAVIYETREESINKAEQFLKE